MEFDPAGGRTPSLAERAKAIILKPKTEWPIIERETTTSRDIFIRYAVPLAAIGPVATFIGSQLFGYGAFGFSYRPTVMASLSMAISGFILSLLGLFIVSFIADKLAPRFGGIASSRNAFKLVAYSMTASWLAGIFNLVPVLGFLAILGLYSFYLFYVGAGPLMKVPAEKALTYTIVTVLCVIVVYIVIGAIMASVGRMTGAGMGPAIGTMGSSTMAPVAGPAPATIEAA